MLRAVFNTPQMKILLLQYAVPDSSSRPSYLSRMTRMAVYYKSEHQQYPGVATNLLTQGSLSASMLTQALSRSIRDQQAQLGREGRGKGANIS